MVKFSIGHVNFLLLIATTCIIHKLLSYNVIAQIQFSLEIFTYVVMDFKKEAKSSFK